jgi:hypothetical protein
MGVLAALAKIEPGQTIVFFEADLLPEIGRFESVRQYYDALKPHVPMDFDISIGGFDASYRKIEVRAAGKIKPKEIGTPTVGDVTSAFSRLDELIAAINNRHSARIASELTDIKNVLLATPMFAAPPLPDKD